jgi:outer membrane protein TolC
MNRSVTGAIVLALAVLAIGGCAVDQTKEVATWRSVLDAGAPPAVTRGEHDALSLEQALALVNRHNERLAMQGENYLQALIDKDRAVAAFLPTVSFAPSYLREEKTGIPGVIDFAPPEVVDVPVEAGLTVNLPRSAARVRSAGEEAARQRDLLLNYRSVVFLDTAQTYYQILRSERQVAFLDESVKVQEARLANIRVRRKAGAARVLDVARVEAQLAGTRAALIAASNDVRNGRAVLALLIGVPAVKGPLTDLLAAPGVLPPDEELLATARLNRRDLRAAGEAVTVAERNLAAAWSRYFPSISVGGSYYFHRESFPKDISWLGIASLDWPIFSAGLIHADVRTAYSQLRQARLAESWLTREVERDLAVSRENVEDSAGRLEQLRVQQAAAQTALDNAEQGLGAGLATELDRLIAQEQFLHAGLDLVSEELTGKIYYLRLLRATGRLEMGSPELASASGKPAPPAPH